MSPGILPHVKAIACQQQQDFSEAERHGVEQRRHNEKGRSNAGSC
jgi:hypothetical protein